MRTTQKSLVTVMLVWTSALCGPLAHAQTQIDPKRFSDESLRQMIASTLCRGAQGRMAADPLTVDSMEFSTLVIDQAIELDPENAELWRVQLGIASATENDALIEKSLLKLVELDPTDEVLRLMRLRLALDQFNTLEDRLAALRKLLTPQNIERMGPAVASRLVLDMALLLRRAGNIDEFVVALGKALELDSSNREAAALAAGYYRMNENDPFAEAELLTNLMLADPTDTVTQVALAQHLLENGAYFGAKRIYDLAIASTRANKRPPTTELLVDQAVAQWASGDDVGALRTIRERLQHFNMTFRALIRREKPEVSGIEAMEYDAPIEPTLATVRAAILSDRQDSETAASVDSVLSGYQTILDALRAQATPAEPQVLARVYLEMAMISAWLSDNVQRTKDLLAEAEKLEPIAPGPKARFDGLIALRSGELDRAIELLTPIMDDDLAARCGLALAMEQKGEPRAAAEHWLVVARDRPGTVMGIWATGRLSRLLKMRVPVTERAKKMEQLIASISTQIDRYPDEPTMAVALRVWPEKLELDAFEPVIINIEIANLSVLPLALDPAGPIRPQVLLTAEVNTAYMPEIGALSPIVVDVGRRLRLLPRERMIMQIDLRRYGHGRVLDALVRNGALMRLNATLNFVSTDVGTLDAGLYGSEIKSPLVRFEGVKLTPDWIQEQLSLIEGMSAPMSPQVVLRFALLGHKAAMPLGRGAPREEVDLNARTIKVLAEAFHKLNPTQQAWVLSALPPPIETLEPLLAEARKSDHKLVQTAYLLFKASASSDPILVKLKQDNDAGVRRLAELTENALLVVEAERQRQAEIAGPAGSIRTPPRGNPSGGGPAQQPQPQPGNR